MVEEAAELTLHDIIRAIYGCSPAQKWSNTFGSNLQKAWTKCNRGEWLLYLLTELDMPKRRMVEMVLKCVEKRCCRLGEPEDTQTLTLLKRYCAGKLSVAKLEAYYSSEANSYFTDYDYLLIYVTDNNNSSYPCRMDGTEIRKVSSVWAKIIKQELKFEDVLKLASKSKKFDSGMKKAIQEYARGLKAKK